MIRIVPALVQRLAPGAEVYGYVRASPEQRDSVSEARLALKRCAVEHRLVLSTVCADANSRAPFSRHGFCVVHNLVHTHHPSGVVIPSLGNLSSCHAEVLSAAVLLRQQGCLLFVVQPSTVDVRDAS